MIRILRLTLVAVVVVAFVAPWLLSPAFFVFMGGLALTCWCVWTLCRTTPPRMKAAHTRRRTRQAQPMTGVLVRL